ncbi:MAG: hypothetical protein OEM02_05305 [Desulfobulbaceae bacterium]|nr:hypothetical protein [Desulfobulbaceae bacterium]
MKTTKDLGLGFNGYHQGAMLLIYTNTLPLDESSFDINIQLWLLLPFKDTSKKETGVSAEK